MIHQLTIRETRLYFLGYVVLAHVFAALFVGWIWTSASASLAFTGGRVQPTNGTPLDPSSIPPPQHEPVKSGSLSNREVSDAAADLCGVERNRAWSLAMRESSGRHYDSRGRVLRSRSGAMGLFQVKPGTARDLGLDTHDRWQNALAGACYYRMMLDRFGDPHRAAVAYHRGPYGGTSQASRDYADDVIEGSAQ